MAAYGRDYVTVVIPIAGRYDRFRHKCLAAGNELNHFTRYSRIMGMLLSLQAVRLLVDRAAILNSYDKLKRHDHVPNPPVPLNRAGENIRATYR